MQRYFVFTKQKQDILKGHEKRTRKCPQNFFNNEIMVEINDQILGRKFP